MLFFFLNRNHNGILGLGFCYCVVRGVVYLRGSFVGGVAGVPLSATFIWWGKCFGIEINCKWKLSNPRESAFKRRNLSACKVFLGCWCSTARHKVNFPFSLTVYICNIFLFGWVVVGAQAEKGFQVKGWHKVWRTALAPQFKRKRIPNLKHSGCTNNGQFPTHHNQRTKGIIHQRWEGT